MQTNLHAIADDQLNTAPTHLRILGHAQPKCRTRAVVDDFYQCQTDCADCGYMAPFGSCYLCMSPKRREYARFQVTQQEGVR
jgi:hypothetical protein